MTNKTENEAALRAIEDGRTHLIDLINTKMDAAREMILSGEMPHADDDRVSCECEYPLSIMPARFKGTKPTALIVSGERITVHTWRAVYTEILKRCYADDACRERLMDIRDKVYGRKRPILAGSPNKMDIPIKISDALYAEAKYDTEQLVYILTKRILDAVNFDYSGISVAVIPGRGYRR